MKLHSSTRARLFALGALAGLLAGCLPTTETKLSLRVVDANGKPIPGALILAGAWLTVTPPLEPPWNRPLAAARGFTDARGEFRIRKVAGFYVGEKPEDWLYKMIESRQAKVDRKVTGVEGGSVLILAPGYGLAEQPFGVQDDPQFIDLRRKHPDDELPSYMDWFPLASREQIRPLALLRERELVSGRTITVVMPKPASLAEGFKDFSVKTLSYTTAVTTKKIGGTQKEKKAVFDFMVEQLKYAVMNSTGAPLAYFASELSAMEQPEIHDWYISQSHGVEDEDTALDAWLTEKALELLPGGFEEPKRYVQAIQDGVAAEGRSPRERNHFYNPNDQGAAGYAGAQTALHWGAIDGADNPGNDWDWSDALWYYQQGDKQRAYEALGHVLHLLEDMAQPERTHLIPGNAGFEEYFAGMLAQGKGNLAWSYYLDAKRAVPVLSLKDHFDGLARLTFGPAKDGGRVVDFDRFYQYRLEDNGVALKVPDDEAYDAMGEYLLPRTIEYAAGLIERFQRDAQPEARADAAQGVTDTPVNQERTDQEPRKKYSRQQLALIEEEIEGLRGKLTNYRQGKLRDSDGFVILQRLMRDMGMLGLQGSVEWNDFLKEWETIKAKHPQYAVRPPTMLAEEMEKRRKQEAEVAQDSQEIADKRKRLFVPKDSEIYNTLGYGRHAIFVYQYHIEFVELPPGLTLGRKKPDSRFPLHVYDNGNVVYPKKIPTLGLKPRRLITFRHRIQTPYVGPVDFRHFVWVCDDMQDRYSGSNYDETATLGTESIPWVNSSAVYQQFCGAFSLDGKELYRLPIQQQPPDTTIEVGVMNKDGTSLELRVGELVAGKTPENAVDGEPGAPYEYFDNVREILIYTYPDKLERFAPKDSKGIAQALKNHAF